MSAFPLVILYVCLVTRTREHRQFSTEGVLLRPNGNSSLKTTPATTRKEGNRDVIICRGVGDMNEEQFQEMGSVWKEYAEHGVITATSSLLYKISPKGDFEPYVPSKGGSYEEWTKKYLSPEGTKSLPHVFCDASCCRTCELPDALLNANSKQQEFFAASIEAADKYGWHGYALDFEGAVPEQQVTTSFFQAWREALASHSRPLELHLWSQSGADEVKLSKSMTSVIDMSAYYHDDYGSSLMENVSRSNKTLSLKQSWNQFRATNLLQTDGRSSFCPAANRDANSIMLQTAESTTKDVRGEMNRTSRVEGLKSEIEQWCSRFEAGSGKCALGLITYDLPNANLPCEDMVQVASHSIEQKLSSIWIWSGGIVPKQWRDGLSHYVQGYGENEHLAITNCKRNSATRAKWQRTSTESTASTSCACKFDGQHCCDGSNRLGY